MLFIIVNDSIFELLDSNKKRKAPASGGGQPCSKNTHQDGDTTASGRREAEVQDENDDDEKKDADADAVKGYFGF